MLSATTTLRRLAPLLACALVCGPGRRAAAQTTSGGSGRDELQTAYADQLKTTPSIFGSAPVYQIIPAENTITFAAGYHVYDVTVAPAGNDISTNRNDLTERLDMTGWDAAPYVAFSAKNFGIGFEGETGKRQAHYLRLATSTQTYEEHLGSAQYAGVGLELFWTPTSDALPKYLQMTVIAGGKSLNVEETSSGDLTEPFTAVTMQKYQYSAFNYDAGLNFRMNLVKHFAVIPWVDYSAYSFSTAKAAAGGDTTDSTVADDAQLFWKSAPALTYGIDFAVKLYGFDIHLGGLIGILGTLDKGTSRIYDNSQSLSISIDTKGG